MLGRPEPTKLSFVDLRNMAPDDAFDASDLACVAGRFQPFHNDHESLVRHALRRHGRVHVAITNADPTWRAELPEGRHRVATDANPFTYWERTEMVRAVFGDDVTVGPFPVHNPELWAHYVPPATTFYVRVRGEWERNKVASLSTWFPVEAVEDGPATTSGTDIRAALRTGNASWSANVHPAVEALINRFLADRPLKDRD